MRHLALAAILSAAAASVQADDSFESPAACLKRIKHEGHCFILAASYSHLMCRMQMQLGLMKSDTQPAVVCIRDGKANVGGHYKAATRRLAAKKEATALLKDAFAFHRTTMDALFPNPGELNFAYEQRTEQRETQLKEKLNRLELEF